MINGIINENWDVGILYIRHIDEYDNIIVTKVTDVFDDTAVKGSILIDMDTRGNFLVWGIFRPPHSKHRSIDDKWDN